MLCVGDVVKFNYEQGCDGSERVAKVVGVRDLRVNPLSPKTIMYNRQIRRNRYLVTAKQPGGMIRSFYTDEIGVGMRVVGPVKRAILYVMGVRF
jgi:hypothetical protein